MDNTAVNLYRKVFGENYSAKSARQQSIDLETFSKIPQIVHDSVTQENFFNALKRYLKNFEKRGWKILSDVAESLQEKLSDYPSLKNFSSSELHSPTEKIGYLVLCDGNSAKFDEIYNAVKNRCRFERYYLMYAVRAWTNELTANYYRPYLSVAKISLILTNAAWAFDHPLGNETPVTSEQIEERTRFSLKNVLENPAAYKNFLAKIYEGDEYFQRFFKVPPIVDVSPGLVRHADFSSNEVNVLGGVRVTADVPDSYDNTIWIFGGCAIFVYAIDDKNTLPSMLQKHLNSEKIVTGGGQKVAYR